MPGAQLHAKSATARWERRHPCLHEPKAKIFMGQRSRQKNIGLLFVQAYNSSVMCVRLSPSHPVTRVIAGLYIFLATFLIGFFVVQAVFWFGS
jgi:hypothetical protein